jgi:ribosomal-protein-serine acetyltransferase
LMQQHHKQELSALIDNNREHLRKWLLWDKRKFPEDLEPIIPIWIRNYVDNNGFDAGIRFKGNLAGMIGLHHIDWKNKTTSIGYFLSAEAQGNGNITRSITCLLDYLFNVIKLNRVQIQCAVKNEKSRAIPKSFGFHNEGITRMANGYMTT